MAAFLAQILCCCVRDQSSVIDETTRLIPSSSEAEFTPPHIVVIDHQKMKERLGTIVRSKEGKMVNVNAHLPFDLYNQHLPTASSSRSASAQRPHNSFNSRARKAHTPVRRATTVNLGQPSTSRSHSSASDSRNHSASRSSSLYYNSIDSVEVDTTTARHPTLNVRLVNKGPDANGSGSQFLRKGRPKSRFGEPGPSENVGVVSHVVVEGNVGEMPLTSSHSTAESGVGGDGDVTPPRSFPVQQSDKKEEMADPEEVLTPTSSQTISGSMNGKRTIRALPDIEFLDAGDIARSWGS